LARLRRTCSRLPAETGGIALNLAGLATFFDVTATVHSPLVEALRHVRWMTAGSAWLLLTLSAIKLCFVPRVVRRELCDPKMCGSHGGLVMALTLSVSETGNLIAVYSCLAIQLLMLIWYIGRCSYIRSPPVPFWFPATVGVGMSAVAGRRVAMDLWLEMAVLLLSAVLCAVLWPWIVYRLFRRDAVAPAPSVFVLGAPVSLVGLAYYAVFYAPSKLERPMRWPYTHALVGFDRSIGGTAFFAASTLAALTTLTAAWRRRRILSCFVEPRRGWAHQEWAGLTFPLVATASVALQWEANVASTQGGAIWPSIIAGLCLLIVVPINAFWFAALPRWLWNGLPRVPLLSDLPPDLHPPRSSTLATKGGTAVTRLASVNISIPSAHASPSVSAPEAPTLTRSRSPSPEDVSGASRTDSDAPSADLPYP